MAPKKTKLEQATVEFSELQAALAAKKAILKEVEEKLAGLQVMLAQKGEDKAALDAEVLNCENVTNHSTLHLGCGILLTDKNQRKLAAYHYKRRVWVISAALHGQVLVFSIKFQLGCEVQHDSHD